MKATESDETSAQEALVKVCRHALLANLGLQGNEKVLVVTDKGKRNIGKAFERAAKSISEVVELIEIPISRFNGAEPAGDVGEKMLTANVVVMPTSKSLSWTTARMKATEIGVRIASMPGITEEIILRTLPIDYRPIRKRVNLLCDLLDSADTVRVLTRKGTDIVFSISGRKGRGRNGGIYTTHGAWGNLPCGEAFVAPVEGSANGVYVVDASQAGVGQVREPLRISVNNGLAFNFQGGEEAAKLQKMLADVGDPKAFNMAEFGVGCNHEARIVGITLEDEKVLGTCHIALGRNLFFGGNVDVGVHVDGVIKSPTIFFDDRKVVETGIIQVRSFS